LEYNLNSVEKLASRIIEQAQGEYTEWEAGSGAKVERKNAVSMTERRM